MWNPTHVLFVQDIYRNLSPNRVTKQFPISSTVPKSSTVTLYSSKGSKYFKTLP